MKFNAKGVTGKVQKAIVNAVDKNGNGKLDREDLSLDEENLQAAKEKAKKIAVTTGQNVKIVSESLGRAIEEAKLEMDRKTLRPVFIEDLHSPDPLENDIGKSFRTRLPNMICIVEQDKKRNESKVCRGAIGYQTTIKGVEMLNIYEDCANQIGLKFFPNVSRTIYYADPHKTDFYICLDEYFDYLKKARVNELEKVAQDLGAKRVQISFKERKKTFVSQNAHADAKADKHKMSASYDTSGSEYFSVEIAADIRFSGRDIPVVPNLIYFKNESDIEKLVQMRTGSSDNRIESKSYRFQCSKSSGIKEKEAAQIDAVLSQLKCSGTASISSEAQRESRTDLEYNIEF